ncbi:GGDEF domain-containing protein [Desulfallas thermosapovorans]|uniref:Diguanylate cyclase (GGDEF)-like protein n=1 Tax=Desulfallas thermosapovorans DSM 6562 TaxID=1121431 RepID=A0A5S4ZT60_9FIRM|nr:GGDEF domain-containing protein [Desulfallas thermosapovorans]TYO95870.1 diguanylate cyclase (GGDEF)-like protein [Desulfallas thermosapovorans DSM 6562]
MAECLSILMIDIDFFKKINDTYGHLTGDQVIKDIAMACKKRIRKTDIIGRYGGEEFAVLLPAADINNAKSIAEHIYIAP